MTSIIRADNISTVAGTGTIAVQAGNTLDASAGFTAPAGHVIQTVQQQISTTVSYSSNDVDSGFNPSITPTSTSSKILIMCSMSFLALRQDGGAQIGIGYKIKRSIGGVAQDVFVADDSGRGGMQFETNASQTDLRLRIRPAILYLDSPNTTSEVTYLISGLLFTGTAYMHQNSVPSIMIIQEIAG